MPCSQSLLIRRATIIHPNGELMVGDVLTRDAYGGALPIAKLFKLPQKFLRPHPL
ncbi:dihydroorotase, multifunctional complex type [Nodularia sp. NIES-3585]|nr:dihydroorotase, multifunctional complex type [Nodularia sp. NIES-3585]